MDYQNCLLLILLLPFISAFLGYIIGKKNENYRDVLNIISTGIELVFVSMLFNKATHGGIDVFIPDIMGIGLYLKLDVFRYIFVWITSFVWFLISIYSNQYLIRYKNRNRYYAFFMLTLGSTIGIFLSENLLNLFTFFEIMSFTSYILVIHDEDKYAHEAGKSYLSMAVACGLVLLLGLFILYDYTATLNITQLPKAMEGLGNIRYLVSVFFIIGFGVKAAMFPLHIWLPKAHPAAPTPASAILSGILVKAGVFGIIITVNIMMESDMTLSIIIIVLGFINMFVGGFLAMFQRNVKRILAYSSMSQIGYIFVGIGLVGILGDHKAFAVYGTLYHIINHALFKVLLFLIAGIVYMVLHDLSINIVRGFGKHKKRLRLLFIVGMFAITGIPGFNGFISKNLIHEALIEAMHIYHNPWLTFANVIFTISSAFTVAYLLKIFVSLFIEQNEKYTGQYKKYIKKRAILPMVILSIVIIYIGIRPYKIFNMLKGVLPLFDVSHDITPHFYSFEIIKGTIITTLLGVVIYIGFIKRYLWKAMDNGEKIYVNPSLKWPSLEKNIYKPLIKIIFESSSLVFHVIDKAVITVVKRITDFMKKISEMEIGTGKHREQFKQRMNSKAVVLASKTDEINGYVEHEVSSISDIMLRVRGNLNSLTYSIFIFAIMLIVALVVMVF